MAKKEESPCPKCGHVGFRLFPTWACKACRFEAEAERLLKAAKAIREKRLTSPKPS